MQIVIFWQSTKDKSDYNILQSEDIIPVDSDIKTKASEIFKRPITSATKFFGVITGGKA